MIHVLRNWVVRYFSDPEAVLLMVLLIGGIMLFAWMGAILAPVIASIIIAYLLQWLVNRLVLWRIPKLPAVLIVYIAFLGVFLCAMFILWPIIWQQLLKLVDELPNMISKTRQFLYLLPDRFPEYITKETVDVTVATSSMEMKRFASQLLTMSIASIPSFIALIVYFILVPIMVFFFLKDAKLISDYMGNFLPEKHKVLHTVWQDVDMQIGNYVRGKVAEVFIVGIASYIAFYLFHLQYAILLAVLVGVSVLVPYVGAAVVTVPVVLVAFFQWGYNAPEFFYLVMTYGIIQTIDGTVLVPLLFSEAVNLHPVAIIVAILVFGGFWGFWGVFFAIPLATLVKAVIVAWPKSV